MRGSFAVRQYDAHPARLGYSPSAAEKNWRPGRSLFSWVAAPRSELREATQMAPCRRPTLNDEFGKFGPYQRLAKPRWISGR